MSKPYTRYAFVEERNEEFGGSEYGYNQRLTLHIYQEAETEGDWDMALQTAGIDRWDVQNLQSNMWRFVPPPSEEIFRLRLMPVTLTITKSD